MKPQATGSKWLAVENYLLTHPVITLALVILLALIALAGSRHFTFDASADTLVVEGDPDLEFYRTTLERFGGDEFMLMTLSPPNKDVITEETLALIATLTEELKGLDGVRNVLSIRDAPLLRSPPVPLTELASGFKLLSAPGVDYELARNELISSPLFRDLLISKDGASTAIRIDLDTEDELEALRIRRDQLRASNDPDNTEALAIVQARHAEARADFLDRRAKLVEDIRAVRTKYQDQALIYIGGVAMIASDMVEFVKSDVTVFGIVILLAMLITMYWFFRQFIWVILPLASAALTNLLLIGLLGYLGQTVTVISSNFVALLAITTVALNIHLIVRYRELVVKQPDLSHLELVRATLGSKFAPCIYTALTTMVAFGSLFSSRILPVEDFGWIMVVGILFSVFVTFTFFPALLLLFPPRTSHLSAGADQRKLIEGLAYGATNGWQKVTMISTGILGLTLFGLTMLTVDNRFLDYFKENTDIYEGMLFVDQNLGGTIPFEVILSFPPWEEVVTENGEDDFDDFLDEGDEGEVDTFPQKYWFTPDKMARIGALHKYIDDRPETGKTLSLATLELIALDFNDGKPLEAVLLVGVLDAIPASIREQFVSPYAQPESGLMRISSRIVESGPFFSRPQFVQDISDYATEHLGFASMEVRTTGMMVLFNAMIEQLLKSQTSTILYVLLAVLVMFLLLLRDLKLALIGLVPNLLAAASVLAIMGYIGLPLDMLTITIAAISVGIGVDDAIHYLYRYRLELADNTTEQAIRIAHRTVGPAMYYTSATVVVGFSILGLSNFVPNITFGLLTALAMVLALLANLGLLPALLMMFDKSAKANAELSAT